MKNPLKRLNFALQRAGIIDLQGQQIKEVVSSDIIENPNIDHCVFGDSLMIYTEDELESIIKKGRKIRQMSEFDTPPNIIVDVFVVHNGDGTGTIPRSQAVSGVRSLHDSFRNQGIMYDPEGVDTGVNFGLGEVYYVDGVEAFGDEWKDYGIKYTGDRGIMATTVASHCRTISGSINKGDRYSIYLYPKITPGGAAGFAWVGTQATSLLAGGFVRTHLFGHIGYKKETENDWTLNANGNNTNKTTIHEVGHSFGLFHTFNSTTTCNPIGDCNVIGDRVCDTLTEMRVSGSDCFNTNPRNHMSYSAHSLRTRFTSGQSERMEAVIINQYPIMFNNDEYNWENPNEPIDPPTPAKPVFSNIEYEILDSNSKTVRFSSTIANADDLELIATNEEECTAIFIPFDFEDVGSTLKGLISKVDFSKGLQDEVSGNTYSGEAPQVIDEDGVARFFGVNSGHMLTLDGVIHTDYTYRIKAKFTEKIGNVQSIISKRIHHQGNQSFFFIFTWNGDKLFWDNTTNNNRRDTGYVPKLNELLDIIVSRNHGMFINGVKVAEPGTFNNSLENISPIRLGNDHTTSGRGMGGNIYSVEVYDRSYTPTDFEDGDDGEEPTNPPTDFKPFALNTRTIMAEGLWLNFIPQWMKERISFRIPAGSQSQWAWLEEGHIPQEATDNGTYNKQVIITRQMMLEMGVALRDIDPQPPIYLCLNFNDTIENQLRHLREWKNMAGVNIQYVELGNEIYLPKFRNGDRPTAPGFIRQITKEQYTQQAQGWSKAIKALFPEIKVLVCGASETGNSARTQWNQELLSWVDDTTNIDGVAIHIYVNKGVTDDEEEESNWDFKTMNQWNKPIHITESGDQLVDYTEAGLNRYLNFYTQIQNYLDSREDGSVNGAHCLYAVAKTNVHYGSLILNNKLTPLEGILKQFLDASI